jgi:hypothetical protein
VEAAAGGARPESRRDPATLAALDHLDRCRRCRADAEATALAVAALRRLAADSAGRAPAADAWPRLRARVDRDRTPRAQVRAVVGGLVTSAALVGVLVGATTWRPATFAGASTDVVPRATAAASLTDIAAERRILDHSGLPVPPDPVTADPTWAADTFIRWQGPDGRGVPARPVVHAVSPRGR